MITDQSQSRNTPLEYPCQAVVLFTLSDETLHPTSPRIMILMSELLDWNTQTLLYTQHLNKEMSNLLKFRHFLKSFSFNQSMSINAILERNPTYELLSRSTVIFINKWNPLQLIKSLTEKSLLFDISTHPIKVFLNYFNKNA